MKNMSKALIYVNTLLYFDNKELCIIIVFIYKISNYDNFLKNVNSIFLVLLNLDFKF